MEKQLIFLDKQLLPAYGFRSKPKPLNGLEDYTTIIISTSITADNLTAIQQLTNDIKY